MMEKRIPANPRAEAGVLFSLFFSEKNIDRIGHLLSPDDFYVEANRLIYTTILGMHRQRHATDQMSVIDELERIGKLNDAGGGSYLFKITDPNELFFADNVEDYARIVARASTSRQLLKAAGEIAALAYEQDDLGLEKAEKLLSQIENKRVGQNGFVSLANVITEYMQELSDLHANRGKLTGVPTGYRDLDTPLSGMQKTDLIILAGRPGSGKTALATNIARNAAADGHPVAIFSLEMSKHQLARRLTSMVSGVDLQSLRSGWFDDDQWNPIVNGCAELSALNFWLNDTSGNPIVSMRAQLRDLMHKTPIELVVVDFLQLIEPDEDTHNRSNRVQEITEISRGLKSLAKDFNVPVLALAQLSRKVEERANKRPILSDLKDSGSIEECADIVVFVYREEYYAQQEGRKAERPNICDLLIAKHRNGEVGEVNLYFKADQTLFANLEEVH